MSTIDKFMVRTSNPSKEGLSAKKCTSSEFSQDSEDEIKVRKRGKRKQLKDPSDEGAFKADAKIDGEAGKATDAICSESTVEISYEDYLNDNCDESTERDLTETKVDESQNAGRDIRSFFLKGPATFKLQNHSFSTIKVKAEIHEPCSRLSGEALAAESPVILPGTFWKQKNGRRKCIKGFIEITDDDLVIECLDDEVIKPDEGGGLLKAPVGSKSDEACGLLTAPVFSISEEASKRLKAPAGIKSNEAGELLKVSMELNSTLSNNETIEVEYETTTGTLNTKEISTPVIIVDDCCVESSAKPEMTMMASTLNGSVRERQNVNDVLMGKKKQLHEPDSQKPKRNSDVASSSSKDTKPEAKKRGRGRGSQVNGCTKKDVDAGEKLLTRDDEETRLYLPPVSPTADSSVVAKPVSSGEVREEHVPELPKELKPNAKGGRLATVNMSQALSQTESSKSDASPVAESEGRGLRRSQRQSAVAAIAAITIAMQESCSKRQKKSVAEDDETIDLDSDDAAESMPEEAKGHSSRRQSKPKPDAEKIQSPSLAPIFMKRNATEIPKKSTPKLSAAERETILIKRNFLLSGVPVELKKIQNIQQLTALPLVDAPFPTHSHTYQGGSADERSCSILQPWCLPEVTLNLKEHSETVPPSVDAEMLHLGLLTSLSHGEEITDCDKIEFGKLAETSKDILPVLLSEVKLSNPSFPTDRVYHQLSMKKNSKVKPNDISKTSAAPCVKEAAVKSKKLSKRKKGGHSDVPCENAEDECSETPSLLWTEKYAPTRANEIIGNWDACKKLRDWLAEWKQVVGRHSSNKHFQSDRKTSDEVSGDFDSSDDNSSYADEDGSLCNTMLLLGAHGIGKTSMVYALAQELDFKVFEVNASGSRDGRYVLTQLQEATQSHQVSRGHQTDAASDQQEEPSITDQAKDKTSVKTKISKQSNPVGGFLERWTEKQSQLQSDEPPPKKRLRRTRSTERRSPSKKQQQLQQPQDMKAPSQDTRRKPSLILFDEVDTVFDDDRGFWSAVQTFMKTTKRPIILTATDRHFVDKFGGRFETLRLRTPRLMNTASYVQLICLLENVRTSYSDLLSFVEFFNGDIRKTLLSLQFWIDSGAARHLIYSQPIHRHVDTCHKDPQTLLAPESKTKEETISVVSDETKVQESDDDFQSIVPRKRRRLQIWSDDESNSHGGGLGSLSSPAKNALQVVEEVSQSCSLAPSDSEFRFDGEAAVEDLKAADEGLLVLPLHRLSGQVVGVGNASAFCPLIQDPQKNCAAPFCRHQNSPILDHLNQRLYPSVNKQEHCADDIARIDNKAMDDDSRMQEVSMKSLYDVYKNMSYTDVYCCAMRRHCANEDGRGNAYWLLHDNADAAISDLEALLGSGVRRKDRENVSVEKEAVAQAENDDQNQNNLYSRLLQENANIVEGTRQSVFQPASTLCTDYMPALRAICKSEELRKATSYRRRFYHYLSNALPTMRCSLFKNMALQFP